MSAGNIHTNKINGYSRIIKLVMKGVYQHCSAKHLKRYFAEFDFRYNQKEIGDSERLNQILIGISAVYV